jgi:methyl-accepting chemotaxis protein
MPVVKKEGESNNSKDNLLDSTNKLVTRIDKLVSLFEEAAKHVGEVETTEAKINALSSRLESLLEQNKAIAQGLLLLEKYVRGKTGLDQQVPTPEK